MPKKSLAQRMRRSGLKYWDLYLLLIPVIFYFVLFKYVPMAGLQIAFRNFSPRRGILGSPFVGFEHFARFFQSYNFWQILWNTVSISLLTLLFTFPLPILLALLLNETRNLRFKKTLQTVTYAPHFLSTVVLVGMMTAFLSPSSGIVNSIIKLFGGEATYFMTQPEWFKPLYILSDVWKNSGWSSIIFMSALAGIDTQLYEAAKIDGANRFKQLVYVTLPGILPTAITMLILNCGKVMNVGFEKVFLMQTDLTLSVTEVISTYVYKQGILSTQFSYATAIGLFNSVVNFALLVIVNQISKKVSETSLW